MSYQCASPRCMCAFEHGMDLRNHYEKYHDIRVTEGPSFWPKFSLVEIGRLMCWKSIWEARA